MSDVQVSKSLLILEINPQSTQAAEQFLRNRGWIIFSTSNLKDFLTYIISKKPGFVMISVDHPNKKAAALPKILMQSFPVCVIAFVENSTSLSFRKLLETQCNYKINPPATGPAIERTVNKYLKDQEKKLTVQDNKAGTENSVKSDSNLNSDINIIQSGAKSDDSIMESEGSRWKQASSIFSKFLEGDEPDIGNNSTDESALLGVDVNLPNTNDRTSQSPTWIPSDKASSGSEAGTSQGSTSGGNNNFAIGESTTSQMGIGNLGLEENETSGALQSRPLTYSEADYEESNQKSRQPELIAESRSRKNSKGSTQAGSANDVVNLNDKSNQESEIDQQIARIKGKKTSAALESIILKGTGQALEQTVNVLDGSIEQELESSSQVACIIVESSRFNGYLIAALGKDRKMDTGFVKAIQEKLFKFLKDNGENISEKEILDLKIKKVKFEDWALECADFLKKSVHNGEEIAMAFFPVSSVRVDIGESAVQNMVSVKLCDLEGDTKAEFNMYVYLPINKKYVLLTPKGGILLGEQKDRLVGKGVEELHMLKSELEDLLKYKAQNYLNKIIDGKRKKKSKVSA